MVTNDIDRRTVLKGVGATVPSMVIAGCTSDGGSGDERQVEGLELHYVTDHADASTNESILPIIQENIEQLGISVEVVPSETAPMVSAQVEAAHEYHAPFYPYNSLPDRLDPTQLMSLYHISGVFGGFNMCQWTSCEYSDLMAEAQRQTDLESYEELYKDALRVKSEACIGLPVADTKLNGGYRNDSVDPGGIGQLGILQYNTDFYIQSRPIGKDTLTTGMLQLVLDMPNFLLSASTGSMYPWMQLFNSPLLAYSSEFESTNVLAESAELSDDGTEITVTLRDATFSNGDQITAEDVKFTYEMLMENAAQSPEITFTEIDVEVQDEQTAVITLVNGPKPSFLNLFMHRWPVMHKETYESVNMQEHTMDPSEEPTSGGFQVDSFSRGASMRLVPHEGHPIYSPEHNILIVGFQDEQPMLQALNAGEIDIAPFRSFAGYQRMQDMDGVTGVTRDGFLPFALWWQVHRNPTQFRDFRQAVGMVVDRSRINQVVFGGEAREPTHGIHFIENHPFFPEDDLFHYVDDPSGDVEGARALLEENGWTWSDNGNLRYPEDRDLSLPFPEGGDPDPADFECINSDGEYVPPSQR